jgi:poly-beta-1,6-N-acetyl-D-glucosamine synthase
MLLIPVILLIPYIVILSGIYKNLKKIKKYSSSGIPKTFVTVIIACRNEQNNLPEIIEDLNNQSYPKSLFEVIIVDDNSEDSTFKIASSNNRLLNIKAVKNVGRGKKRAIMTGVDISSGEFIITTDADCRMGNNWIKTIAGFYETYSANMIIGPVRIASSKNFFGKFQELEFLSLQGITAGYAEKNDPIMCNGANLSFTKESYLNNMHNLHFELSSGDDIFLLHSIKASKANKIMWLESTEAMVTTAPSSTIKAYIHQRKRWLSKAGYYKDNSSIVTGIVTFVTILTQISTLTAGIFHHTFFLIFFLLVLIKSIPDYLILKNTTKRYGKNYLMRWFIPSQIVYPFYVFIVAFASVITSGIGINFPSQKGT